MEMIVHRTLWSSNELPEAEVGGRRCRDGDDVCLMDDRNNMFDKGHVDKGIDYPCDLVLHRKLK